MHRNFTIASIAAAGIALAACGQSDTSESSGTDNTITANEVGSIDNNMMAGNDMAATTVTPQTTPEFAAAVAASDKFEIESSKLAESQASDAKVKDFAAMLVRDHTKSTDELKSIAAKEDITLAPPTLTPDIQSKIDALKAAKGAEFDTLYLSQQIPAHETALKMLQDYAATGDNEAVKGFASKTSNVVQKHLEEARNLSK